MKKNSSKLLYAIPIVAASLFINSCKEQEIAPKKSPTPEQNIVYQQILDLGLSQESIKDKGSYYLVGGDIAFYKDRDYSLTDVTESEPSGRVQRLKHITTAGRISYGKQRITVRVHVGVLGFMNEILEAINEWNFLHSNIYLQLDSGAPEPEAVINIDDFDAFFPHPPTREGSHFVVDYPSGGLPGPFIRINPELFLKFEPHVRRFLFMHAIGHTLGFLHTDEQDAGGIWVPGSPTTDAISAMNSFNIFFPRSGVFSSHDKAAMQIRFPPAQIFAATSNIYGIAPREILDRGFLTDSWFRLNSSDWRGTTAMATVGDNLYLLRKGTIFQINRFSGEMIRISRRQEWDGALAMAAAGTSLYIVSPGGCLYRVSPRDGTFISLGCSWNGTQFMTGGNTEFIDHLFILRNGTLYDVDVSSGTRRAIEKWTDVTAMTYGKGSVFIISGGNLVKTGSNGAISGRLPVGDVHTLSFAQDQVWFVLDNTLYTVLPSQIGAAGGRLIPKSNPGDWRNVDVLTSFETNLETLQNGTK